MEEVMCMDSDEEGTHVTRGDGEADEDSIHPFVKIYFKGRELIRYIE
jgi:hypothetical protein